MALQLRRGTEAQRVTFTPLEGELIYVTDTGKLFVGNGTTVGGVSLDEQAQDATIAMLQAGTHSGISYSYNDSSNALSFDASLSVDTSPQLSANLDLNNNSITGDGSIDISGYIRSGSFIGSVFADDSTLLVNAINGKLVGEYDNGDLSIFEATLSSASDIVLTSNGNEARLTTDGVFTAQIFKVTSYADTTERDAAIPAPEAGMIVFVLDDGVGNPRFQGYVDAGDSTTGGWKNLN